MRLGRRQEPLLCRSDEALHGRDLGLGAAPAAHCARQGCQVGVGTHRACREMKYQDFTASRWFQHCSGAEIEPVRSTLYKPKREVRQLCCSRQGRESMHTGQDGKGLRR